MNSLQIKAHKLKVQGMTNGNIGRALGVATSTVGRWLKAPAPPPKNVPSVAEAKNQLEVMIYQGIGELRSCCKNPKLIPKAWQTINQLMGTLCKVQGYNTPKEVNINVQYEEKLTMISHLILEYVPESERPELIAKLREIKE